MGLLGASSTALLFATLYAITFLAPPLAAVAALTAFGMTGLGYFTGKHIEPSGFEKTWTPQGRGARWAASTLVEGRGLQSQKSL
jgi:hypothetical protein